MDLFEVLCASLAGTYVLVPALPFIREFFALAFPGAAGLATALVGAGGAVADLVSASFPARFKEGRDSGRGRRPR